MNNQSQHGRSNDPDAAIDNALQQAESAVMVDRVDLARRREALLGWMADRLETDPKSPTDGSKAEAGAPQGLTTDLAALTTAAATALVSLLATERWERTRAEGSALWRRADPGRVDEVLADLEDSRSELVQARNAGDERIEQYLVTKWHSRLTRLVSAFPETVDELHRLLAEWMPAAEAPQPPGSVTSFTHSSGGVPVYQAAVETSRH